MKTKSVTISCPSCDVTIKHNIIHHKPECPDETRKCIWCGEVFHPADYDKSKFFCSEKCWELTEDESIQYSGGHYRDPY